MDSLRQGIALLEELRRLDQSLSVRYTEAVDQLNVHQLERDFAKAGKSIWPLSWWGQRKVRQQLEVVVSGQGSPRVDEDLATLVAVREQRAKLDKLDVAEELAGVWRGWKSRLDVLKAAACLQDALKAVRTGASWTLDGLEPLKAGRGGDVLAAHVGRLEQLAQLDAALQDNASLTQSTEGLWAGLDTSLPAFEEAIAFTQSLSELRRSGGLTGQFAYVAQGVCGQRLASDHAVLTQRAEVEARLAGLDDLKAMCPGVWKGLETKREELGKALSFQRSIAAVVANLASGPADVAEIREALAQLLTQGNTLLNEAGPVAEAGQSYVAALGRLQLGLDALASRGSFVADEQTRFADADLVEIRRRSEAIVRSEHRLNAWCAWRKVSLQAQGMGLGPLVTALQEGSVAPSDIRQVFETNYCRWWLNAAVDSEPVIRSFVSAEHERRIADFRTLDKRFTDLTKAWLRAKLCQGLPVRGDVTGNSEWGLLRNEITKKRRHKPLRELISSIPNVLTKLTPCLLMSPLSIAQYLSPEAKLFDVVVFDEASQIPVWDAIGAIARGRQVIMVGDPKQLPPTSFFDRAESSMDDEDVEVDMESILDECIGSSLPTLNLNWHYRSRNESLIAFSNHHYYGGRLVTFPSPVTEDRSVSFHYVAGTYEKGGARINKAEAKAVVADIVQRLKSPGFRDSRLTIGVVTFNAEQQKLIEDLLDEERRQDPDLEPYFAESELEPLFVKNLENVQGDERDIIYFSITYGPNHAGHVSMNFGPMNRSGGERRLNVAITRARQELLVFSSLRAEQIDLSKTQAAGVRDLKHFLEFAERGPRALAEATTASLGGFDSPFEEAVAAALASRGWQVHTQVGASAFRIDLAVVHPDAPGRYLCGIECDGATYHRSATARDRDKLREQVLCGLGWEILRVWSIEWWLDSKGVLERICTRLEDLVAMSRARRASEAEQASVVVAPNEAIQKASGGTLFSPATSSSPEKVPVSSGLPPAQEPKQSEAQEPAYARLVPYTESNGLRGSVYVESDPRSVVSSCDPEAFFGSSYDDHLAAMVMHVVEQEGPVLGAVLARRISRAHGWQRTGSRIQERVETVARRLCKCSEESVGTFYWPARLSPGGSVPFRPVAVGSQRPVDEVCMQELVSLAILVIDPALNDDENLVAMARQLGLQRLRAPSRGRLEEALWRCQALRKG